MVNEKENKDTPKDKIVAEQGNVKESSNVKGTQEISKEKSPLEKVRNKPGEEIRSENVQKIVDSWKPKTLTGKNVLSGQITDIDEILDLGEPILEPEIVDLLLKPLDTDLLLIGQAKGKFGGGQRRVFRQTQKKTREGNKIHFAACAVVGNKDGYVGVGYGKSKETVPAREKAIRNAKLSIMKIRRGSGSWESAARDPTSVPFTVRGKSGSVKVSIIPAPKGKGIIAEEEIKKILKLAGIEDAWTKTAGHTKTKINLIRATVNALQQLMRFRLSSKIEKDASIIEGRCSQ